MKALRPLGPTLVYDVMDDWEGLCSSEGGADGNAGYSVDVEEQICRIADFITSSAATLAEHLEDRFSLSARPVVVPNSLDPAFLHRPVNGRPDTMPTDGTIIGYVGSIWGNWQDWDTVLKIATAKPDWQIVLVGGSAAQCAYRGEAAAAVAKQANVTFIAEVPQAELHRYIDAFDVAIIPFVPDGITRFVHPLKIYDYLARCRPVVSSPLPEIQGFPHVRFADSAQQWLEAIEAAITDGYDRDGVQEFLAVRTWERAVQTMLAATGVATRLAQGERRRAQCDCS